MEWRESVRISWRNIRGHKLRSTLTAVGVIIGIAAVVAFLTFGVSFKADVVGNLSEQNEPTVAVVTETSTSAGGFRTGNSPVFTERDVDELRTVENVRYAAPLGYRGAVQFSHGNDTTRQFRLVATTPARFSADATFSSGGAFESGTREVVVNPALNRQLEENLTAGDEVQILLNNGTAVNLTVAGVLEESVQLTLRSASPRVYVPIDPMYETRVETSDGEQMRAYPLVVLRAESIEHVSDVKAGAESALREGSDASELKQDGYEISAKTVSDFASQIDAIFDRITAFITGIAVIALLVGSIGIANIMLVSVTERTREIGVLKAVGATRRDVLQLFLVESIIIGLVGAVFGVVVGLAGAHALGWYMDMQIVYPVESIAGAMVAGFAVGIVAGLYPAWRAARIDPIEALRYE